MRFDIITIFPEIFGSYFSESLIDKAQKKGLIEIYIHNLRDYSNSNSKAVDGKPYGGGRGMVMKIEPIYKVIKKIKKKDSITIFFSPRGKKYSQKKAIEFSKYNQIIMICGRYEGVDERVKKHLADESISIGDYVLIGGEIPAMVVLESVSRIIPGVIGIQNEGFVSERLAEGGMIEYPQYTRPEVFETEEGKKLKVPKVLLSGNHKDVDSWKDKKKKIVK